MLTPTAAPDTGEMARRFAAAGIIPPTEFAAGTFANAQRLLSAQHWLRQPRSVAAEPSNTFSLAPKEPV